MSERYRFEWRENEVAQLEVDRCAAERGVTTGLAHAGHWRAFREGRVGIWDAEMANAAIGAPGAFVEPVGRSHLDRWTDDGGRTP